MSSNLQLRLKIDDLELRLKKVELEMKEYVSATRDLSPMTVLSLPGHLQKTYITLGKQGIATAQSVADSTNRARALESSYLNQMVRLGLVTTFMKGRQRMFIVRNGGDNLDSKTT